MIDLNRMRELDLAEITVRVARFADDTRTPISYQAIARARVATTPWGVGVRSTPEAAVEAALADAALRFREAYHAKHGAPSKYGF